MRIEKQTDSALNKHGVLLIWLDPHMHWYGRANGKPGRTLTFSDVAVQFCLAIKGLFDLPLRQAMDLTEKLLYRMGLNWAVPDFSTVSRRRKQLREVVGYGISRKGWHLLVDDYGIQIMSVGEWKIRPEIRNDRRQWLKLEVAIELR
ncbi:transposase [Noviherbaspirillum pedocola]|uniref:Transposase n=1 Tax=Noviherbaspirillum pedocola TaxID=2801341 RepID=A0A934SVA6_9BURK|nr:transposase [Noviherbaspirillum pedocola]MBK4733394.1 transposase [Noviherbaspirillum pedocola]